MEIILDKIDIKKINSMLELKQNQKDEKIDMIQNLSYLTSQATETKIDTLMQNFNDYTCKLIYNHLVSKDDPEIQHELYNFIEVLFFRAAQNTKHKKIINFFDAFRKEGLIYLIEQQLKTADMIKKQDDDSPFSGFALQLVCIFVYMKKGLKANKNLLNICTQIIGQNFSSFHSKVKKASEEKDMTDNILEKLMQKGIKILQTMLYINQKNIIYINGKTEFWAQITLPIHLNCHQSNCNLHINTSQTTSVIKLQTASIQVLNHLSDYYELKLFIYSNQSYLNHFQQIIIDASKGTNLLKSHFDLIQTTFTFLSNIVAYQTSNQYNANSNSDLLPSLINFIRIKTNLELNKNLKQNLEKIQLKSLQHISNIHLFHQISICDELINKFNLINVLIQAFGVAGGCNDMNISINQSCIKFVCNIFMKFHQKTQTDIESQQQLALKKVFEEKFEEEEDVSDEIEAQIFSHQNYPISILYDCAETKKWQLNVLKDQSNRKPWEQ